MDPGLIFWTGALLPTAGAVGCALAGWRSIRRGDVKRHRRYMNAAIVCIGVFLASYLFKVLFLGKEQLEQWSRGAVNLLWVHETFVLAMIVAGSVARVAARRLAPGSRPAAGADVRKRHRWAGRSAVVLSFFALATAAVVLVGMYQRSGGSP